ncbi:flagellar hook assembly protein FlgD [Muricoccus radiodurans]|uniref:flagellar hook assembly protein FlgD n=1 Tax=Muricoccus radiodurans TaxID=2231721 RepID=UPI003CEE8AA1
MAIASTAAAAAAAGTRATTGSAGSQTALVGNFDTFLTMLTTQLKNQSPTDPLDTNQMTSQLVQFASVEQQIAMNKNLETMVSLQQASQLAASAPMIGRQVEVEGDSLPLQNGAAAVRLPAAGAARTARVVVTDSSGNTIREAQVNLGTDRTTWRWDGRDANGRQMADGAYRVAVTGADASGNAATTAFTVLGTVTGAERSGTSLQLRMGAAAYGFDKVRSVSPGS